MNKDYIFLHDVMRAMKSSLDMEQVIPNTLTAMKACLPVAACLMQQYSEDPKGLKILFIANESGFYYTNAFFPTSATQDHFFKNRDKWPDINIFHDSREGPIAPYTAKRISDYIPNVKRSYFGLHMRLGDDVLGYLAFAGPYPHCFNEHHEHLASLLLSPLTLVISNLLRSGNAIQTPLQSKGPAHPPKKNSPKPETHEIIGLDLGLKPVAESITLLSDKDSTVLISGETGTGKELVADAVQSVSSRKYRPFVKINCGAIPDTLMDSVFFGHEKGAFTGAAHSSPGKFELADGGTLFLDEVGELPLSAQTRLLRVLQNKTLERLGGTKPFVVDIRIIAATNKNLEQMVQQGTFRRDLYYRLNVFPILIPPLRERPEDITPLITYFVHHFSKKMYLVPPVLDLANLARLCRYTWPGNVRELQNTVERALVMHRHGNLDLSLHMPQSPLWYAEPITPGVQSHFMPGEANGLPLLPHAVSSSFSEDESKLLPLEELIREHIITALKRSKGKVSGKGGAAELLGMNHSTLRKRMQKMGLKTNPWA